MRTFIAIEIPEIIRKSIYSQITAFKGFALPIKWVSIENLHITLKFLGEITEKTTLEPLLRDTAGYQKPFAVTLRDTGCFPNARRPRVVWIGVDRGAERLSILAQAVEEALLQCGFPREGRFHPHLTIGRIKKPCSIDGILEQEFMSEQFPVNSLVLFKSTLTPHGAVYEPLQRFVFDKY